jgi:uncharacterized protein YkwD
MTDSESAIGRLFTAVLWIVLLAVLASVLVSAAATVGVIDTGPDDGTVDTPDPLPNWPFVWEVPIGDDPSVDPEPDPDPDEGDVGDPVREDPGTTSVEVDDETVTSDGTEERVHERVNAIRADHGLSEVGHDDGIASIARTHSHDMGEREYFSHVSPEGETPADRFGDLHPGECRAVGENLALVGTAGTEDADEIAERIVEGWMDSEDHRENILTARWDDQGIGIYIVGERAYATQKFCDRG